MKTRDKAAEVIALKTRTRLNESYEPAPWHKSLARDLDRAGLLAADPDVITSADELDALPWGSIVHDRDGDVWQKVGGRWRGVSNTAATPGELESYSPITVLYRGKEEA